LKNSDNTARVWDAATGKASHILVWRSPMGEADYQTQRAVRLAPVNEEVKKVRSKAIKLLNLPSDAKATNYPT
jgi:hypothetical protein